MKTSVAGEGGIELVVDNRRVHSPSRAVAQLEADDRDEVGGLVGCEDDFVSLVDEHRRELESAVGGQPNGLTALGRAAGGEHNQNRQGPAEAAAPWAALRAIHG